MEVLQIPARRLRSRWRVVADGAQVHGPAERMATHCMAILGRCVDRGHAAVEQRGTLAAGGVGVERQHGRGGSTARLDAQPLAGRRAAELAETFDVAALVYNIATLERLRWAVKNSDTSRALLEASLLRFALSEHFLNVDQLLSQMKSGAPAPVKKKVQRAVDSPSPPLPQVTRDEKPSVNREPEPAPAKSQGPAGSSNIQSVKNNWQETLELIKNELGPGTSALLSSAVPSRFEDGVLTLELGTSAQTRMSAINGRVDQIETFLSKQFPGFSKLKFNTVKNEQVEIQDTPTQAKTVTQKRTELLNDPAVKTVLLGLDATVTGIEEN